MREVKTLTVWTIGHGAVEMDEFVTVLRSQGIDTLVDVRSAPYSRYAPQFNREILEQAARHHGITYVYYGGELGGEPSDNSLLLRNGKPDYAQMEAAEPYRQGIEALKRLAASECVCLMCSEEDPLRCHRSLLIAETLQREGIGVVHLRNDGTTETHAELVKRRTGGQLTLF